MLEVPTPSGWRYIADLKVGDNVFADSGQQVYILSINISSEPQKCYLVVLSDGTQVTALATQRLQSWDKLFRKSVQRTKVMPPTRNALLVTAPDMLQTLRYGNDHESNHAIHLCNPLDYPTQQLPIDPYLLGVWLGDGCGIQPHIATADHEIIQAFSDYGYRVAKLQDTYSYSVGQYYPSTVLYRNGLRRYFDRKLCFVTQLRQLGVLGNKHVPNVYLRSSIRQRTQLLMGLMDTDGTIGTNGSCSFDNTNRNLVDAVEELLVSLGCKVTRHEKRAFFNGVEHKMCYRAKFTPRIPVFSLPRKAERQKLLATKATQKYRYVLGVQEIQSLPLPYITTSSSHGELLVSRGCIAIYP